MSPRMIGSALASAACAMLALAGCTGGGGGGDEDEARAQETNSPVIVPGRPGEEAHTANPEDLPTPPAHNDADVRFVQMMIPHHQQALTMTALVADRTQDPLVRGISGRIEAAQKPEIAAMRAWLDRNDEPEGEHQHELMPGMASPDEMDQLRASGGRQFERLFLQLMITHHQGAVTMSTDVMIDGSDLTILQMAQEIMVTQNAEIDRMHQILEQ